MSVGVLERGGDCPDCPEPEVPTLRELIIASAPRGYWPLDDVTGTTIRDATAGGHDGVWTGSPTRDQAPLFVGASRSVDLSGTGQYGLVSGVLNPAAGSFSFHVICQADSDQRNCLCGTFGTATMMAVGTVSSAYGGGTGIFAFGYYLSGWKGLGATPSAQHVDGTPYQYVGVFDAATHRSWLLQNGLLAGVNLGSGGSGATSAPADLGIGRRWDTATSSPWDGRMSDVAVWDRALTFTEMGEFWDAANVAP